MTKAAHPELTAQRLRDVLAYDPETGLFTWRIRLAHRVQVGDIAGDIKPCGRRLIGIDGRRYKAHRLAWLYVHGEWPRNVIDHINGQKADNRLCNLRDVTHAVNQQNVRRPPSHKKSTHLMGVTVDKRDGRWSAKINVDKRTHFLGRFATAEEAHAVYIAAKRRLHPGCTI